MVTESAVVTVESLQQTTIVPSNGSIADPPTTGVSPKMGVPHATPRMKFTMHAATSKDIDKPRVMMPLPIYVGLCSYWCLT